MAKTATPEPTTAAVESLRDRIFSSEDIPSELVPVPEWGVTILVKGMSGFARAAYLKSQGVEAGEVDWEALYPSLLINTCYDPDDPEAKIFRPGDAAKLNTKAGSALERVAKVASRLSGLADDAEKEALKG